jgi:amphi-Trp domain-containing protein
MKFKKKESMSRDEAAERLAQIADALAHGGEFELERGGEKVQLDVPDQVALELEVEIKDGETELEVEIKWPTGQAGSAGTTLVT